jgi:arylsulfatase A-like enzyme
MQTSFPLVLVLGCARAPEPPAATAAPSVFHLADHLAEATVTAVAAGQRPAPRTWPLTEAASPWRPLGSDDVPHLATVGVTPGADRWTIALDRPPQQRGPFFIGGVQLALETPLAYADWESVHVRAHTTDRFAGLTVTAGEGTPALPAFRRFFGGHDDTPPLFSDGSTQTYAIPLRPPEGKDAAASFDRIAVLAAAPQKATLELLEITLVPRGASYGDAQAVVPVVRGGETRTTLYAHTDTTLTWKLTLPEAARLDVGLSALPGETVTYRFEAKGTGAPVARTVQVTGDETWKQETIDLATLGGEQVELALGAVGPGSVAFWGAPVVSGRTRDARPPNVVFYVIDGGGADLMSLYGYGRKTTPALDALAKEGVVFERAYANATWTQPSTVSFMTSLQHSVLGGLRRGVHSTPVPDAATTMAEHMRTGGYQTASFTSNPNAGRMIGIERGMDVHDDSETEDPSTSSPTLHERFWRWRANYPGGPWWVHFQTTDVHEPNSPVPPFAGTFAAPGAKEQLDAWHDAAFQKAGHLFGTTSIFRFYQQAFDILGIDSRRYYGAQRDLYDETMAFQDQALAKFVEELKAKGEWENTILVVGSDHGHPAGTFARWGRGLLEPQPDPAQGALFDSYATHVPLVVIWPGHLTGRRAADPVSMIDVMPTILELCGLPAAEVAQGRSLVPLLRGEALAARPVILDEFRIDERTGDYVGNLDVVDGKWGASLEIGPVPAGVDPNRGRHDIPAGGRWGAVHPFTAELPRLLLYDLEADPFATKDVNEQHPELVAKYQSLLEEHWKANQALAQRYLEASDAPVTPEQLEQLKSLGYVQ